MHFYSIKLDRVVIYNNCLKALIPNMNWSNISKPDESTTDYWPPTIGKKCSQSLLCFIS